MCRHCEHKDLASVREELRRKYDPNTAFGGDLKTAMYEVQIAQHFAKKECSQARRAGEPTYKLDYIRDSLRFVLGCLNANTDNGGNYFIV